MVLTRKSYRETVPKYSLTGDLLSFLRCPLQYRYHNGSSLPPSRPVQLWFGEFIHGVMESAYRIWRSSHPAFPWPLNITQSHQDQLSARSPHDIGTIGDVVEATLRAQGKVPRSSAVRINAYTRAFRAVNELGPDLFPLISSAEERVIGTRSLQPSLPLETLVPRSSLYELHGIIDVLTHVQLGSSPTTNVIRRAIETACPLLDGNYEIIVDYKGSRRPATTHSYWQQHDWQIQTYAWLRGQQPDSIPVAAGVLLYVNELAPGKQEIVELKRALTGGNTDIAPTAGSPDAYQLSAWRPGDAIPELSLEFRLARTIRVIPVSRGSEDAATREFDGVVSQIEQCVAAEAATTTIMDNWEPQGDQESCAACDFRHFCPNPHPHNGIRAIEAPHAP